MFSTSVYEQIEPIRQDLRILAKCALFLQRLTETHFQIGMTFQKCQNSGSTEISGVAFVFKQFHGH